MRQLWLRGDAGGVGDLLLSRVGDGCGQAAIKLFRAEGHRGSRTPHSKV